MQTNLECLKTIVREHSYEPLEVEGKIPSELNGTLFRVGVGRFEAFGKPLPHWFDGDGAISAIRFLNGKAQGAVKILDVTSEVEKKSGTLALGRFGVAPKALWRRIAGTWSYKHYTNSANTALMHWQDKLYSLYEGSLPTRVDPETLSSLGAADLGVITRSFTAHPKRCPSRSLQFAFGFKFTPVPMLEIYILPDKGEAKVLGSVPYNGATFIHDFFVTAEMIGFFISPMFVNPIDMILKAKPLSESMTWKPAKKSEILLIPIDDPKRFIRLEAPPVLYTHTANSYSEGNQIIVDAIVYQDGSNMDWINSIRSGPVPFQSSAGQLHRFTLDPVKKTIESKILFNEACEVPQISPQFHGLRHRFIYAAGFQDSTLPYQSLYDCIHKFDLDSEARSTLCFGDGDAVSEPIFVSDPKKSNSDSEDDGYLLNLNYDFKKKKTYCAVSRAQGTNLETLAKVWFDQSLPFTFHGIWLEN